MLLLTRAAARQRLVPGGTGVRESGQLQIVTYTGGRNRDGETPAAGARIRCMASGVVRKRRSALAAVLRYWRSRRVACQQALTGGPAPPTLYTSPPPPPPAHTSPPP